jgi:hypothetical protein
MRRFSGEAWSFVAIVVILVGAIGFVSSTTSQAGRVALSNTTELGCFPLCIVNPNILPCGEDGSRTVTISGWSGYCASPIDSLSFFPWHQYNASEIRNGAIILYFNDPPCAGPFNSIAFYVLPNGTQIETLSGVNVCVVNGTTTVAG